MGKALVIGASGGIGAALLAALPGSVGLSRADGLDVTDEDALAACLARLTGPFGMVIVATGALAPPGRGPEKALRALDAGHLAAQFAVNAAGPMLVLKHVLPLMPRDRRVVFAALSARVGSIGDNRAGGWYSYRASKAALNQLIRTASIEVARTHPQAVLAAVHPGTVATRFTEGYPAHDKVEPSVAAANILAVLEELGPQDTGGFFDWSGARVPW